MRHRTGLRAARLAGFIPAEDVPKIEAALMLQFAGNDERVNAGLAI